MASSGPGQASDPLQTTQGGQVSSNAVEMQNLEPATDAAARSRPSSTTMESTPVATPLPTTSQLPSDAAIRDSMPTSTLVGDSPNEASSPSNATAAAGPATAPTTLEPGTSPPAIGPSFLTTQSPLSANDASGPVCLITLLLTSGPRHPFKLDEKYLTKRNVSVPATTENGKKDPFSISVYTLKELILREWREEWETKPSSPSSIRLIHFGRLLDDKLPLRECRFTAEHANVVHMTIKPQDMVDDEEASKSKALGRERGNGEGTPGCRCVIL